MNILLHPLWAVTDTTSCGGSYGYFHPSVDLLKSKQMLGRISVETPHKAADRGQTYWMFRRGLSVSCKWHLLPGVYLISYSWCSVDTVGHSVDRARPCSALVYHISDTLSTAAVGRNDLFKQSNESQLFHCPRNLMGQCIGSPTVFP